MQKKYSIIAYYKYVDIEDPKRVVKDHKRFLRELDVRARIYIAYNGINAQMSMAEEDAKLYTDWLVQDPCFANIEFKIDPYHEHVFPKLTVKFREQLVALDSFPDLTQAGKHLSPKEWKEMLEKRDEKTLLIDIRNDYESEIGHFEGAERPAMHTFRQFPKYAAELADRVDPQSTNVMMYCTGGIRCEVYSALLKEKGFNQVYQLQGGVINYGHREGNAHWKGKLFVFDDRLSVPISEGPHELVSHCLFCDEKVDTYYNCANMDCNELFLCCPDCGEKQMGCCSKTCRESERRRPFVKQERPKPFRKWYAYGNSKEMIQHDSECGCVSDD